MVLIEEIRLTGSFLFIELKILKEPIVLDKKIDWIEYLNKQEPNASIDDKYLVTYAGFEKDRILEKIKISLQNKFKKSLKKLLNWTVQI